ncbi:MAG TPA: hypothetical protein PLU73_12365, partial [Bacteroidia bacterium]|nr:hypothetical protein [Bacteroidia bacterium]
MKTHLLLTATLGLLIRVISFGQILATDPSSKNTPYNGAYWSAYADKLHFNPADKKEFLDAHQRIHAQQTSNTGQQSDLIPPQQNNQNNLFAGPCVNIDFESGNINGWTGSSGYHPIFNPI